MTEPTETPLPALWRKFLDEVAQRTGGGAPAVVEEGGPYRAMQLYLDIEERAVRLAVLFSQSGVFAPNEAGLLWGAITIARHLRTRLGLPADPTP